MKLRRKLNNSHSAKGVWFGPNKEMVIMLTGGKGIHLPAKGSIFMHHFEEGELNGWSEKPDYPVDKAVDIFVAYGKLIGADDESRTALAGTKNIDKAYLAMMKERYEQPYTRPAKKVTDPVINTATTTRAKGGYKNMADFVKQHLRQGLTDGEVLAAMREFYGEDVKGKEYYPKYYRQRLEMPEPKAAKLRSGLVKRKLRRNK
jgi:hypothetical protein